MDNQTFVNELSKLKPSSTFLSLIDYENASGEIANYSIVFHMSYEQAVKKSLQMISEYEAVGDLEIKAKNQLIESYQKSLDKMETTPMEEIMDGYQHFRAEDGYVKGVKLHLETGNLHLYGLLNKKSVKVPGTYKDKKSSELTLVKNRLSKNLPVSKFRQFTITADKVSCIRVQKIELLPVDE